MKVILDTNVFISGIFYTGLHKILETCRDGRIQLIVSPEILGEYHRVGELFAQDHLGIDLTPGLNFSSRRFLFSHQDH